MFLRSVISCLLYAGFSFASSIDLKLERYELANGLTVLLHENRQAPTVSCRLFYATGSVHEKLGQTGLAHMLEHMLFKGTRKVGITDSVADARFVKQSDSLQSLLRQARISKDSLIIRKITTQHDSLMNEHRKIFIKDELWEAYLKAGGTGLNAYTTDLVTAYFVTLPRNKVELFLWLEADRMQNAVLREFYPERDVVREERRMRYDDSPTGRYFESLEALFYESHPYRNSTIGYPSDIAAFTREAADEHYRKYYKPNNSILVFAGDFSADSLKPLIQKYFANIPRGEDFPAVSANEPDQAGTKRLETRRNDAKPRMDMLFHTPGIPHPDIFALDIMESVLNGRSGRLYKRLVEQEKLATQTSAGNNVRPALSAFELEVEMREGVDPKLVEKVLWDEIRKLQTEKVSERELTRVRNQLYASKANSLADMETVASMLAYYELYGDASLINRWLDEVSKVTPEQIQVTAKRWLQPKLATVGQLLPEDK